MKTIFKYIILFFIVTFSNMHPMKIDRVIMSSNDNPLYIEFWPLVAKTWTQMGVKPTLALIGDKNVKVDESLGDIIRFEPIESVPSGFYAQCIRLLIPILYPEEISLTSDIDVLPLNKKLLIDIVNNIPDEKFVVYNDGEYANLKNIKVYPMCYNAGKGKTFQEIFKIKDKNQIPTLVQNWYTSTLNLSKQNQFDNDLLNKFLWLTDERMLALYLHSWDGFKTRCIKLGYRFNTMIDRNHWEYKPELLKSNYYRESHLPRPYSKAENKKKIDQLLIDANKPELIQ